jgi:hypothetical protein
MIRVVPFTVKAAQRFVREHHRRLPKVQGGMWAVGVIGTGWTVGVAIVGLPPRMAMRGAERLVVLRLAVAPPAEGDGATCSKLYGACARAARAMGCVDLWTYVHIDEPGTSLRASGWIRDGETKGGEHNRVSRPRAPAADPRPKVRWCAPWSAMLERRAEVA